jgi:hypothetical protein
MWYFFLVFLIYGSRLLLVGLFINFVLVYRLGKRQCTDELVNPNFCTCLRLVSFISEMEDFFMGDCIHYFLFYSLSVTFFKYLTNYILAIILFYAYFYLIKENFLNSNLSAL